MRPSYLRQRDRGNYKESVACLITKASNSSHFRIPLIFVLYFPSHAVSDFFFFLTFSILEIKNKKRIQRRVTIPQGQQHGSSVQQS